MAREQALKAIKKTAPLLKDRSWLEEATRRSCWAAAGWTAARKRGFRAQRLLGSRPWARVASSKTDSPPEAPKSAQPQP